MKKSAILFAIFFLSIAIFAQWSDDPAINTSIHSGAGEQAIPKIVTSPSGITYIAWFSNEGGNYNVRLQLLDINGNKMWGEEGLLVSDHPSMSWLTDWDMAINHNDHAILTFQDIRNDGNNDVFAYCISPNGEFIYGEDGIELSNGPAFDVSPKVTITNDNNAIFAWQAEDVIIMQKIDKWGYKDWGPNGHTINSSNTLSWPQLLPVGDDDVIMKYFEDSGPAWAPTRHVFAQRFETYGNPVWDNETIISNAAGISAWTQIFPFLNDGNDGFYIAWHDDRDNNGLASIYVQHIDFDGQILFNDDGIEVSTMPGRNHFYPDLALPPGSDDLFIYWNEMDGDQNSRGIYGQKISSSGERLWTDNGKVFIEISSTNVYPLAARNTNEDMIVIYESSYNVMDAGIKAMRIDTDGNFIWEDDIIDMCTVQSEKVHSVANQFLNNQIIAVWEDSRNGDKDIYGQNIQLDGTLGPIASANNLTVIPDTLFCESYEYNYAYILNNSSESILIDNIDFEFGWHSYFIEIPDLPYNISAGDYIILEIGIIPGSDIYNFIDMINIESEVGTYLIIINIDSELIAELNPLIKQEIIVQIYPNPFTEQLNFNFMLEKTSNIQLSIFNTQGQVIKTIRHNMLPAGKQTLYWDGKNETGISVNKGIYYYRISVGETEHRGKVIKG